MNFEGETIRLTPLDDRLHLIDRGPLVLADMKIALATEPDSLQRVVGQYAIDVPDGHPEEWVHLEVELTELGESAPAPQTLSNLVVAATRTSNAAIEVWGPTTASETWPYMVVPWVDFETMGACAAAGLTGVSVGGSLFQEIWGWHSDPPTESMGFRCPSLRSSKSRSAPCGRPGSPRSLRQRLRRALNGRRSSSGPSGRATFPGVLPSRVLDGWSRRAPFLAQDGSGQAARHRTAGSCILAISRRSEQLFR